MELACALGSRSTARRVLSRWLSVFRTRQITAESFRKVSLTRRVFTLWKVLTRQSLLLAGALKRLRARVLALVLWGWLEWGVKRRQKYEKVAAAVVGMVRRKMEAALEGWKRGAARKRRRKCAERRGLRSRLGRVWGRWAGRAKKRVLLRRVFASAEARWAACSHHSSHHSEFHSSLVCFASWRELTLEQSAVREEQVLTGAADVYNRARLLTRAFLVLRSPVDAHRAREEERLFRRRLLWAWRKWAVRKTEGATARVLERFRLATGCLSVGEYNRRRVLRSFLCVWRAVTDEPRARGETYRAASLVRRAWASWVRARGERAEKVAVHISRWGLVRLRAVVNGWVGLVTRKKERKWKVGEGTERVQRRLKAAGLAAWKEYREHRQHRETATLSARQHADLALKRLAFRCWLWRLRWRALKQMVAENWEHRLKRATWRALVRHTRESHVVRALVTGSRTGGLRLTGGRATKSGRETPESGRGTPKSGRETPATGVRGSKVGRGTLESGRDALKGGEPTLASGRGTSKLGRAVLNRAQEISKTARRSSRIGREALKSGRETPVSTAGTPEGTSTHGPAGLTPGRVIHRQRATSHTVPGVLPSPLGLQDSARKRPAPEKGHASGLSATSELVRRASEEPEPVGALEDGQSAPGTRDSMPGEASPSAEAPPQGARLASPGLEDQVASLSAETGKLSGVGTQDGSGEDGLVKSLELKSTRGFAMTSARASETPARALEMTSANVALLSASEMTTARPSEMTSAQALEMTSAKSTEQALLGASLLTSAKASKVRLEVDLQLELEDSATLEDEQELLDSELDLSDSDGCDDATWVELEDRAVPRPVGEPVEVRLPAEKSCASEEGTRSRIDSADTCHEIESKYGRTEAEQLALGRGPFERSGLLFEGAEETGGLVVFRQGEVKRREKVSSSGVREIHQPGFEGLTLLAADREQDSGPRGMEMSPVRGNEVPGSWGTEHGSPVSVPSGAGGKRTEHTDGEVLEQEDTWHSSHTSSHVATHVPNEWEVGGTDATANLAGEPLRRNDVSKSLGEVHSVKNPRGSVLGNEGHGRALPESREERAVECARKSGRDSGFRDFVAGAGEEEKGGEVRNQRRKRAGSLTDVRTRARKSTVSIEDGSTRARNRMESIADGSVRARKSAGSLLDGSARARKSTGSLADVRFRGVRPLRRTSYLENGAESFSVLQGVERGVNGAKGGMRRVTGAKGVERGVTGAERGRRSVNGGSVNGLDGGRRAVNGVGVEEAQGRPSLDATKEDRLTSVLSAAPRRLSVNGPVRTSVAGPRAGPQRSQRVSREEKVPGNRQQAGSRGEGDRSTHGPGHTSPLSMGGLSPWGVTESAWSPEGVFPRKDFGAPGAEPVLGSFVRRESLAGAAAFTMQCSVSLDGLPLDGAEKNGSGETCQSVGPQSSPHPRQEKNPNSDSEQETHFDRRPFSEAGRMPRAEATAMVDGSTDVIGPTDSGRMGRELRDGDQPEQSAHTFVAKAAERSGGHVAASRGADLIGEQRADEIGARVQCFGGADGWRLASEEQDEGKEDSVEIKEGRNAAASSHKVWGQDSDSDELFREAESFPEGLKGQMSGATGEGRKFTCAGPNADCVFPTECVEGKESPAGSSSSSHVAAPGPSDGLGALGAGVVDRASGLGELAALHSPELRQLEESALLSHVQPLFRQRPALETNRKERTRSHSGGKSLAGGCESAGNDKEDDADSPKFEADVMVSLVDTWRSENEASGAEGPQRGICDNPSEVNHSYRNQDSSKATEQSTGCSVLFSKPRKPGDLMPIGGDPPESEAEVSHGRRRQKSRGNTREPTDVGVATNPACVPESSRKAERPKTETLTEGVAQQQPLSFPDAPVDAGGTLHRASRPGNGPVRWPLERAPRITAETEAGQEKPAFKKTRHGSLVKWPPAHFESSGSQRVARSIALKVEGLGEPGGAPPGARIGRVSAPAVVLEGARWMIAEQELVRGFKVVEPECELGPRHRPVNFVTA